ncbi:MAG: hypothetical protein WBP56_23025 [Polyangia bacterium]
MTSRRSFFMVACLVLASGCGQELDVGSDVLWTARFEGDNLAEWSPVPFGFGSASAVAPNTIEVSSERVHSGNFAAKLTVSGTADNTQGNGAGMVQNGGLPTQAYYSAWYYLPQSVSVGTYWVIMKFRMRTVLDDPTTEAELFDVNFQNPSVGAMSLRLYDHRSGDRTLDVPNPVVSVGAWFQLEAFYRDAADATGRLTLWLNGVQILDLPGATGPTAWVAWDVVSVGDDLTPDTAIIYVDDCAISQSRVGLTGLIAQ